MIARPISPGKAVSTVSIRCPDCGKINADTARFCNSCSGRLTQSCPNCQTENSLAARFCHRCGKQLAQPQGIARPGILETLPTATLLAGRYKINGELGEGGMGAVYLVDDMRLVGKQWAVKEMSDDAIPDPVERRQAIQAFRQEAQMLAALDHANLPKVIDFFTENGNQYLVMEFVPGVTLEMLLQRANGPLSEASVLDYAGQLCAVLDYLHKRTPPIIFRDLKPANIMIQPDGRLKLIDFGIARHFKPGQGGDTQAMGTPGYAAPEQYGKGQTDARSDIYALGATLHYLLTAQDPTHTPFTFAPIRTLNPSVSPQTEQLVARAVAMDKSQRWPSIAAMQRALHAAMASGIAAVRTPVPAAAVFGRAANPVLATPIPVAPAAPRLTVVPPAPAAPRSMTYASYGKRTVAFIFDAILAGIVVAAFAFMGYGLADDSASTEWALYYGLLGLATAILLYFLGPTAASGQTVGKRLLHIRVVDGDGASPGWIRALIRYGLGFPFEVALCPFLGIGVVGWLWPLWDKHRQAWHDYVAGTYVIET
jgi:serine/threonine-protein kinase